VATTEISHQVLIGGTFTDSVSGATMDVINPATGEKIAQVPSCTAEDVDNAVQAAKDALPEWLEIGKIDVNAACRPSMVRFCGWLSACRNAVYASFCICSRYGTSSTLSRLPKLLRMRLRSV